MRILLERDQSTTKAEPSHFTGTVWRTDFIRPDAVSPASHGLTGAPRPSMAGSRFLYEPGARSYWHIHEQEQAIIAVHGVGLVAWEGLDEPALLQAGDWWHVHPGIPHWHGATTHTAFAHLAVTAGGPTHWLHEVAEQEYHRHSPS